MNSYRLCDHPSRSELKALGVQGGGPGNGYRTRKDGEWVEVRAVASVAHRVPEKGDWYLNNKDEAHRSLSALTHVNSAYRIARLAVMRQVTTWEEV